MRWLVMVVLGWAATAAASPFDKPSFTATPAEVLAVAKAAPKGAWDAIVLRYEVHLELDGKGRRTTRTRFVYAVHTADAVDGWDELFYNWRPFFQDKPTVRARVIAPDGRVVELDRARLRDEAVVPNGDRRSLVVPLPTLSIGAVVEHEVVVRDRVPILGATGVERIRVGDVSPTLGVRVTVTGPVASKLQLRARNFPAGIVPRHETKGAIERWSYDFALPATPRREANAPAEVSTASELWVGTAASWGAVARELRGVVDRRIAEGPVALPAGLPTAPTLDTVRAIKAWIDGKVRHDRIGMRDSAIVPSTPAATLQRGTADTKDLATLLVAALRQVKLRAELVLIAAGPRADIEAAVPGLDEFDRTLVRVRIGNRDVWIDPSDELAQAGVLMPASQGRRALVIADDTTTLVETPRARASDNVLREVRTFEIPERGAARMTSVTHVSGTIEAEWRRWVRDTPADRFEKALVEDVKSRFVAKGLERHSVTPPSDLAKPFSFTMVVDRSERASGDREQLAAYLFPSATVSRFFASFSDEPRTSDWVWDTPHVHEIESRLIIPDGFVLPSPASTRTRRIGTITFTHSERLEARTYIITFRVDTGKHRLSPAEVVATAKALEELDQERVDIVLELTSLALERDGKVKQAIAEVERLIKLHPKEALHHSQLVPIYMRAGMGAAARRAARKAVQLAPNDADPYVVLGWALRYDSVGRESGYDHDRAGALAAYQRARKLDPEHVGAMVDYATLLEAGSTGRRYDRDADVRGAVPHWRAAAAADPDQHSDDLLRALVQAELYQEAETVAAARPASPVRNALWLAAIAGGPGGVPAAIAKAGTLAKGTDVAPLLDEAAGVLFSARAYDRARGLFGHTNKYGAMPAFAAVLAKIRRVDVEADRGDPRVALGDAVHALADPRWRDDALWDRDVAVAWREAQAAVASSLNNPNHATLEDVVRAVDLQVEGAAKGPWRIAPSFLSPQPVYLVRDRGIAKVIGWSGHTDALGGEVLRALARNDQRAAFQLLDWVLADGKTGVGRLLGSVWANSRTKDAAQLAGALLSGPKIDAAIPILRECKSIDATIKKACVALLGNHLARGTDPKALEAYARARVATDPGDPDAQLVLIRALVLGRKLPEATKLVDTLFAAQPSDEDIRRTKAFVLTYEGKFADAIRLHETTGWGKAAAIDLNQVAWLRLVANQELDKAVAAARTAAESTGRARGAHLHTLAALEIEVGNPTAANTALVESMAVRFRVRPEAGDWYVYGRIAEHLELVGDAREAYRKVVRDPTRITPAGAESHDLAARRLKALR